MEDIKGIYKFTNKTNQKSYIGQSNRIEERYKQHQRAYLNKNHGSYHSAFCNALRKYGFDNFEYEILVESDSFTRDELDELEIQYIQEYKSFGNGYNMNKGGNFTSGTKTLADVDVLNIKSLLKSSNLSLTAISKQFNVSPGLISMINNGIIWNSVGSIDFPIRNREDLLLGLGERNANAKIDDKKAIELRTLFIDHTLVEVHQKNKELLSLSGMKKLLYGVTFKHLPVYKKRQKQWFLNGTCIDYPRIEE